MRQRAGAISRLSWAFYDFADTAYSALYTTFFFPIFVVSVLGGTELHVGIAFGGALLVAALLVPALGALADATGRKRPLLIASTLVTVALVAATGRAEATVAALVIGALAHLMNLVDVDLYDAYLVDLVGPERRGRLSGFGVAFGYLGTIASLVMGYLVMNHFGWDTDAGIRAIFPAVAVFFLVFALPQFLFVRDLPRPRRPLAWAVRKALQELRFTITRMRELRGLPSFLGGSFLYTNGMNTVIIFLALYATKVVGLSVREFFFVLGVFAVGSVVGSLLAGKLSDRFGPKALLTGALLLWVALLAFFIQVGPAAAALDRLPPLTAFSAAATQWATDVLRVPLTFDGRFLAFLVGGTLGGGALGAVWVGNRHMVARLAPPHKVAELYGIEGLTEKFSGFLGPIVFGFLATTPETYPRALASLLVFFLLGLLVLRRIPRDVPV